MPASRSILSVVKMMLEAELPHAEILATLNACLKALPKPDRHPVDRAPFPPAPGEGRYNGDSGDKIITFQADGRAVVADR